MGAELRGASAGRRASESAAGAVLGYAGAAGKVGGRRGGLADYVEVAVVAAAVLSADVEDRLRGHGEGR